MISSLPVDIMINNIVVRALINQRRSSGKQKETNELISNKEMIIIQWIKHRKSTSFGDNYEYCSWTRTHN